ncbi:MAG: pseudouridine synthase [Armatimonadetes bacterium]|nr:pseudouridine synthase [Armatimonadota bacterium]NIM23536.1 pseudouridine synthase [Armatimonadota bacterium]NIM67402.1 pseudouridine synthase [Armatimonadota bacterium]NIM75903.1 pseudouridine synthase [Armatimonadota bacterium]NIN05588.1 pseudouridine synthase [Armatimonadota bacterium]
MERLQKLLAAAGVASRRKAERLILEGRVTVDGRRVTRLGEKADPSRSKIMVDGRLLEAEPKTYILLNKPKGPITSVSDPQHRPVVTDLVQEVKVSLRPVGRLDAATEGLLLLTNDGQLAYRLTHPRWGVEKVYQAEVSRRPNAAALRRLRGGIALAEGKTPPARARMIPRRSGHALVEITIHTGWRRQVRRMLEAVGCPVMSLRRVQLGPIKLGNLPRGKWRRLNPAEVRTLWKAVAEPRKAQSAADREPVRTNRVTRPARRQDVQTRIRRGDLPTKTRTR